MIWAQVAYWGCDAQKHDERDEERSISEESQRRASEQVGAVDVHSGHHCCQTTAKLTM